MGFNATLFTAALSVVFDAIESPTDLETVLEGFANEARDRADAAYTYTERARWLVVARRIRLAK